jgi:hypothetical protein
MDRELPTIVQVALIFFGAMATYVVVSLLLGVSINWPIGLVVALILALGTMIRMLRTDGLRGREHDHRRSER